jgi:Holliday junction resolvase RusA-like endonuclease
MEWVFQLAGPPLPWQRSRQKRLPSAPGRSRKLQFFPSREQADYQARLRAAAKLAGVPLLAGPVELALVVAIAHRKSAYAGGSGDGDNYIKQVGDALNRVCWADDCQVVRASVDKRAVIGNPYLEVRITGSAIARAPVRLVPNVFPRGGYTH